MHKLTRLVRVILVSLIAVGLALPTTAYATMPDADGNASIDDVFVRVPSDEEIQQFMESSDLIGGSSDAGIALMSLSAGAGKVENYAGSTMYETSVLQCKAAFPDGCPTAIVVGREGWQDALASAGLAGILGCPILYVESDRVPDATAAELERLGVSRIVAVGGPARIGERLVKSWRAFGIEVEWLWGEDCLGTQMAVYGAYEGSWGKDAAIIATSTHFADALCVSPAAYRLKAPIFLTDSAGNLPASSSKALSSCGARDYVAVGGPAVLSSRARSTASSLASSSGGSYEWLWGQDMYGTSSAIASWAAGEAGVLSWDGVAFATGRQPYDALSGSVLQGLTGSVMLVADRPDEETVTLVGGNRSDISTVKFFGGTAAVEPALRDRVNALVFGCITKAYDISLQAFVELQVKANVGYQNYTAEQIKEYVDPSNFTYGTGDFYQFAVLNEGYSGAITANQISDYIELKWSATGRSHSRSALSGQGQAFVDAAAKYGVNEIYLLAHAALETGWGDSILAQGCTYDGKKVTYYDPSAKKYKSFDYVSPSGKPVGTYHNFFGINATDTNTLYNGFTYAIEKGWDSPAKAIAGGAEWITTSSSRFLNNQWEQNTLYLMKWNVAQAAAQNSVWKQYATSRTWPLGISSVINDVYARLGISMEDSGLTFQIPQFS